MMSAATPMEPRDALRETLCLGGPLDGARVHVSRMAFTCQTENGDEHRYGRLTICDGPGAATEGVVYLHSSLHLGDAIEALARRERPR